MGGKSKQFLKEAVPTIFRFAPETARKRRKSSIRSAEKSAEKCVLKKLFPTMKPVQAMSITKTY